jgi:GWxTD domain-containing protein
MTVAPTRLATLALVVLGVGFTTACGGGRRPPRSDPERSLPVRRNPPPLPDAVRVYRQMGLLAEGGETPFTGSVAFLAGASPDSTLMLLTVSLPSRGLTFVREGDRYRASYGVTFDLRSSGRPNRRVEGHQIVRVASFKETTRTDESIIFRQAVNVSPGTYDITLALRDDAGNKNGSVDATLGVPRLGAGGISTPVPFYEVQPRTTLDAIPRLIATPRSTVTFGQDSLAPVYVEAYGDAGETFPVRVAVRGETGAAEYWSDSIALPKHGSLYSGVVNVPVSRIGIGVMMLAVERSDRRDSTKTPIFVTFGEDLPVATFTEMIEYLRYFGSPGRVAALRGASPDARATAWMEFLRETDPVPETPQHEGLRAYFGRIAIANARYREEGTTGWLTDRGRVFVSLGTPDQVFEPTTNNLSQQGRAQIWDYHRYRLQVVFIDQTGFGRWRMTMGSESEFESVVRRELAR